MATNPQKNARNTPGRPFKKGNPGLPEGARGRAAMIAETLMQGDAEAVTLAVINAAKRGDIVAAKVILDRICPPRRDNPVNIRLPQIATASNALQAMSAIFSAVGAGAITPAEAEALSALIDKYMRIAEVADLGARVAALEARENV